MLWTRRRILWRPNRDAIHRRPWSRPGIKGNNAAGVCVAALCGEGVEMCRVSTPFCTYSVRLSACERLEVLACLEAIVAEISRCDDDDDTAALTYSSKGHHSVSGTSIT